jgi:two-component system CheB/CheR fusion protein
MKTVQPIFIVGIGGSAGALNAYKTLLDAMPYDTGMAFVIISHMNPTAHNQLALILSRHTNMSVIVASEGMPILANHVYVIPPDSDLTMEDYSFKVISPRISRNKQVDIFFISLADAMGVRAVGIILSGYDGDGTEGCRHIKAKGGTTFAQDMSAEVDFMPLSAHAAGCADFVLPLNKIPDKLKRLAAALKLRNDLQNKKATDLGEADKQDD